MELKIQSKATLILYSFFDRLIYFFLPVLQHCWVFQRPFLASARQSVSPTCNQAIVMSILRFKKNFKKFSVCLYVPMSICHSNGNLALSKVSNIFLNEGGLYP